MAGCIYCGKTGKRLCDSCAERLKKRNLQFLFPLSSSDVSAISAICKPKPESQKAVWTASSGTANKNTAARTYTPVKQQPKVTASKPTSGGSVVSPRNNDVQYEGPCRLLKAPIGDYSGKGKYTFANGDIYEGDFVNGERTGKGKYTWTSGEIYKGDFVNDKCTGRGKLTFSNGDIYVGDFVDGKCVGKGKYMWSKGDVYEGHFVNHKRTGYGVCRFANGEKYIGEFIDGKRHGYGTQYDKNGVVIHRGKWENDKFVEKTASTGKSNANNISRDNSEDTVSDISALVVLLAGAGILLGLILAAIFTPWHIGQWFASSLVSIAVLVGFIISSSLGSYFYFHNVFFLLFSSANIVLRFYFQAAYKPFFILVSIALFISFVYLMFCEFDFDEKRRGRITLLIESVSLLIQMLFLFAGEDWFYDTLFPFFEQIFTYVKDLF